MLPSIEKLKKTGGLEKLMAAAEMSSSSVTFDQLRDAIADMDQFTDAIEKQLATHQTHIARQIAALRAGGTWIDQRSAMEETKRLALLEEKARLEEEVWYRPSITHLSAHCSTRPKRKKSRLSIMPILLPISSALTKKATFAMSTVATAGTLFRYRYNPIHGLNRRHPTTHCSRSSRPWAGN